MTLFGKALRGIKKGAKAVGKGVGNAAKFTVKNPLKVLAPLAGVAGVLFTGGALAPALVTKLAASKVGGTLFGKIVGKVMKSGTVVRKEIAKTLIKQGKPATEKDIDAVQAGIQAEAKQQLGYELPVDRTSSTADEAMQKLEMIKAKLGSVSNPDIRQTLDAERQILIDNPETNGILKSGSIPADVMEQMKNAGTVKENLLGQGVGLLGSLLGVKPAVQEKTRDVLDILTGKNNDPYLEEDMATGVNQIEKLQNQSSMLPSSVMNIFKMPIVWIAIAIGGVIYFINRKK